MTPLRQRMAEDMKLRHFSPETRYRYILAVERFAQHFDRSPERLGSEQAREFLVMVVASATATFLLVTPMEQLPASM